MRRVGSLLIAVFFLVFLAGLSPHLVHHVFDDHDDVTSPEPCALAAAAERHQLDSAGEIAVHHYPDPPAPVHPAGEPTLASIAVAVVTARAPPPATS